MIPPAARSNSTVMPKSLSNSAPLQATISSVIATAPAQVQAIRVCSAPGRSAVKPAKMPTLPNGFIIENKAAMKLAKAASAIMSVCPSCKMRLPEVFGRHCRE